MSSITSEKLAQAAELVKNSSFDAWITFVRETCGGGDPVLPLILEGALTWQSALIVTKAGGRIAVVGNYDADPLKASGDWTRVVPYVQGIREPLVKTLEATITSEKPKIGVNFSTNDVRADGLSHGMFMLLKDYLRDSRFEDCLESAEDLLMQLRGQKTPAEVAAMSGAIRQTECLFEEIAEFAKIGKSEREVFEFAQGKIAARSLGYAWDATNDPIVNSGPDSMIGHGVPSAKLKIEEGHIFHVDLGVIENGYSSDLQRSWYVGSGPSPDALKAFEAVHEAISAGAKALEPGAKGMDVDAVARRTLVSHGYEEYLHALGHQVGRVAHDGGAILGPKWERYGRTPDIPIRENEVYTLELGVIIEGRGYLGLEEMVAVRPSGVEWLSRRQDKLWTL